MKGYTRNYSRKVKAKVLSGISTDAAKAQTIIDTEFEVVPPRTGGEASHSSRLGDTPLAATDKLEISTDLLIAEFCRESAYVWVKNNRSLKGRPMDFVGEKNIQKRKFLIQPLEDTSQYKGYQKARQVGVSEISVSEALWFLQTRPHTKSCYVLPSGRQVQDFSNTRVVPAIDESPLLSGLKGEIQNVNLKQIGDSFLFMRSGALERLGEGIDADMTFFDELDRMSQRIKVAFEESLQGSEHGYVRDISTPSVPNFGVNIGWEKSKQWHWFITCSHCGTKQELTWLPDDQFSGRTSVAVNSDGNHIYACKHCERGLREEDRWEGEWVAKYPDRAPSFYHITQMMSPWISAQQLFVKQEDYPFKQLFFNYCLGIPYLGDNILVTEQMIYSRLSNDSRLIYPVSADYYGRVCVGVDWGDKSFYVVMAFIKNKICIIDIGTIEDPDPDNHSKEIAKVIEKYDAEVAVCDAGYGRDRNARLLKQFPERIFSCFYPNAERGSKIFEPQWQEDQSKVSIDRTNSLKLHLGYFKSEDVTIARNLNQKEMQKFIRHLCNLVSVKDIDDKTGDVEEWIANMGVDHYGHAYNYAMTAMGKLQKLPKSEFWTGEREIKEALDANRKKTLPSEMPVVPGYGFAAEHLATLNFKGVLKGQCYGKTYDATKNECQNCRQHISCKNTCEGI